MFSNGILLLDLFGGPSLWYETPPRIHCLVRLFSKGFTHTVFGTIQWDTMGMFSSVMGLIASKKISIVENWCPRKKLNILDWWIKSHSNHLIIILKPMKTPLDPPIFWRLDPEKRSTHISPRNHHAVIPSYLTPPKSSNICENWEDSSAVASRSTDSEEEASGSEGFGWKIDTKTQNLGEFHEIDGKLYGKPNIGRI